MKAASQVWVIKRLNEQFDCHAEQPFRDAIANREAAQVHEDKLRELIPGSTYVVNSVPRDALKEGVRVWEEGEVPPLPGAIHFRNVAFEAYDKEDRTILFATTPNATSDVGVVIFRAGKYECSHQEPYIASLRSIDFLKSHGWVKREVVL